MAKPLEVLHRSLNSRVIVELRGNRGYRGILDGYDIPHMNLVLRNAEEIVDGNVVAKRDKVIVRGDNIIYISPP
ncbi:MAG: small nuclear ribonucleoprotein [Thermoplasmata archaeon]|nr:MAG: small nuclear ribonucleoprotein [Thermoplasmata archaeon]